MASEDAKRPGIVSFAGVMILLMGFFELVSAIEMFRDASWLSDISGGIFGDQFIIWGIIDLVIGLVALYAGYSIFKGKNFGRWAGVIVASVSAIRWFWLIWSTPWMAFVMIFLDIIIIFGLMQDSEWFD